MTDPSKSQSTPAFVWELLDELRAAQRALNTAGWEIVKLRRELGLNQMHADSDPEKAIREMNEEARRLNLP